MYRIIFTTILVCCVLARPSMAQEGLEPNSAALSPGTARALSALGTVVPIALGRATGDGLGAGLLAGGLVLGPALGYVYAGQAGTGLGHVGIRAAVLGGSVGAAALLCNLGDCHWGIFSGSTGSELLPAVLIVAGGVVATTVLAAYDINRVGHRVRSRNQRLASVTLSPTYLPESRTVGLVVTWRH